MYLYGDRDPDTAAVLREQSFQCLVGELLLTGKSSLPVKPLPCWEDALRLDLLASDGTEVRAGSKLVLIPAVAVRDVLDMLSPALTRYVEVAREVGTELCSQYSQTCVAERFTWPQVSHTIIAGFFLDLAMGLELFRSGRIERRPAGETVIWVFQTVSAENAYGVCSVPADPPHRAHFAELWHRRSRRADPRLTPSLVEILSRIARGEPPGGKPKELLYLKHLRLVRSAGGSLQVQVPVFAGSAVERLLGPLTEGGRRLVEEAIVPGLDLLRHHDWWQERIGQDAYRHAAVRLLLEHGIDSVIAAGICDPFPDPQDVPVEWGRWVWEEAEGPKTLLPHVAARGRENV